MEADDLLALDAALEKFAAFDPEKAELVKLKFFAGLPTAEAVVLCNAGDAQRLLAPLPTGAPWPLRLVRGQTTLLPAASMPMELQISPSPP